MWSSLRSSPSAWRTAASASKASLSTRSSASIISFGTSSKESKQIFNVHTLQLRLRHSSSFAKSRSYSSYFNPSYSPRRLTSKRLFWALPIAGALILYYTPQKHDLLPLMFSSPHLIPVPPPSQQDAEAEAKSLMILSPSEELESLSLLDRLIRFLRIRLLDPIATAGRFVHLFFIFIPVILTSPMLLIGVSGSNGDRWGALWWYDQLVFAMERAGPTFIKLAQWAASRADLFPDTLCERLGSLHSSGKPHSIHHTRRVIERVFQRPFETVFEEFDETPIGVGAIAQVYRATLRHDLLPPSYLNPKRARKHGNSSIPHILPQDPPPTVPTASVAIKILHPRVEKNISRDLSIMYFFARAISILPGMQWISLPEEVEVFGGMMAEQLDLRIEADNLRTFERNFTQRKSAIAFPRPLVMFSTRDMLIEEYQNALPLKTFLKNGGGPYDIQIAELGLDAFLNMLLLDNFVHSDLHPGNIMIKFYKPSTNFILKGMIADILGTRTPSTDPSHSSSSEEVKGMDAIVDNLRKLSSDRRAWQDALQSLYDDGYLPEVVFLDAGLVTTLNDKNRRNFLDLFRAIAEFDGYRAGQLMVERCRTPSLVIDAETFALRMQHLVLSVKRKTFSLGRIKISDILSEVLRCVRQHHVKMEGDFVNTVISVLLLEGIGRQLDPGLDLFKSALPILRKLGRQMTAQESMESMSDLPHSNLGAYLKLWVWLEARQLASAAFVDFDEMIRTDWLTPNI